VRWLRLLRTLPPWRQAVYWLASIVALALVIWDIVDKSAQYTSIVVFALVVIATVALQAPDRRSGKGHWGLRR
jgi:di/tricarboxylate transporter